MKYKNPKVDSSYGENNLGKDLYEAVIKYKPKKIIEFGILNGYSTISMAMALDELKSKSKIKAYDLFEKYEFKNTKKEEVQKNIDQYGLTKYVVLKSKDFNTWLKKPEKFDLLHLDISNKGDTVEKVYKATKKQIDSGSIIIFEGGSKKRDAVAWMKKYNCKKINDSQVPFKILNSKFPSISIIKK